MFEFFTKVKYVQPACRLGDAIVFFNKNRKTAVFGGFSESFGPSDRT